MWAEIDTLRTSFYSQSVIDDALGGNNISSSAGAHVQAAYISVLTNPSIDAQGFWLSLTTTSGTALTGYGLLDIAQGAAGEEVMIVNDLLVDITRQNQNAWGLFIPCAVKAGTGHRVVARWRTDTNTTFIATAFVFMDYTTPRERYLTDCETIGTDTTDGVGASSGRLDSGGSQIDPGGATTTFGAWKELTAGTTYPFRHAILIIGYLKNVASGVFNWRIQVGIGASGQEEVVWDELIMSSNAATDKPYPQHWSNPLVGAAGARVCVRAMCDTADATDRLFQCAMYLFRDAG